MESHKSHEKKTTHQAKRASLNAVLTKFSPMADTLLNQLPLLTLLNLRQSKRRFNRLINEYLIKELSIKQIACGEFHSVILLKNGRVLVMGENNQGQLGLGEGKKQAHVPTEIEGIDKVKQIGATDYATFLLTMNKQVLVMGLNKEGVLGVDANEENIWTPRKITTIKQARRLKSCYLGSLVRTDDNKTHLLGSEVTSRKINGRHKLLPRSLHCPKHFDIKEIVFGPQHALILTKDQEIFGMGSNENCQLGLSKWLNTGKNNWVNLDLKYRFPAKHIFTTSLASFVVTTNGDLLVAGTNNSGQLGDKVTSETIEFKSAHVGSIKQLAVSDYHTLILSKNGKLFAMGDNQKGQLGIKEVPQPQTTNADDDWSLDDNNQSKTIANLIFEIKRSIKPASINISKLTAVAGFFKLTEASKTQKTSQTLAKHSLKG